MDQGRKETDRKLLELERKIKKEYEAAERELREKLYEYFEQFFEKDKRKRDQLARGVISSEDYRQWKISQIIIGRRWQDMVDNIAADLVNYEQIAKNIANGYMPDIYALNMNYSTYDIEHRLMVDTNFTLYNRDVVEHILRDEPELLPPPGRTMTDRIAAGLSKKWHRGQLQSVVLQTILQGDSVPDMATRIAETLCVSDRKAAIRYARTAITGAENLGRLDSFYRVDSFGIKTRKTWLATLDSRTRDAHRELDAVTVDLDKPFVNSLGKIMHPGDLSAAPGNVWNCRCTMVSAIEGFETDWTDPNLRNTRKLGDMSYDEWKKAHGESQDILMPDKVASIMRARYAKEYRK